jgi:hypothetical protein
LSALLAVVGLLAGLVTAAGSAPAAAHASRAHHGAHHHRHHGIHVSRAFFGLHDKSNQAYGHVSFGSIRLWDAYVTWSDIETSPGVYDWSRLDGYIAAAQAHHVQVTVVLAMTPSFYAADPSQPPSDLGAYVRYVRAIMSRYRNFDGHRGITAYQVWNEGNVSHFWTGTPHQLALMTRVVARVRNQVDPGARVVAPSFAVRMRYQRLWMSEFEKQRLDGRPIWHFYDANALSLYPKPTYGHRPGGPEDAMALADQARHQLAADGVPHTKQLWATEINYGLTSGSVGDASARPISQRHQVANVLRTYLLSAAHGLDRVFWYRYDWDLLPASMGGGTLGNTLLTVPGHNDSVTAAGRALGRARAWLRGRLVRADGRRPCARGHDGTYACTLKYRGATRTIYWNPHRQVRVRVPGNASRVRVLGRSARRHAGSTVKVGYRPVMVRTHR